MLLPRGLRSLQVVSDRPAHWGCNLAPSVPGPGLMEFAGARAWAEASGLQQPELKRQHLVAETVTPSPRAPNVLAGSESPAWERLTLRWSESVGEE